jgi:hypothetical protein
VWLRISHGEADVSLLQYLERNQNVLQGIHWIMGCLTYIVFISQFIGVIILNKTRMGYKGSIE